MLCWVLQKKHFVDVLVMILHFCLKDLCIADCCFVLQKTSPHVSVKPPTVASSSALISTTPESQRSDVLTQSSQQTLSPKASADNAEALMWVDRYKPTSSKQIIGQQGDKSNAKKLFNWLTAWHKNLGKKPVCMY